MNGEKRILVFSEAGGTGRSYHADKDAQNHQKRIHYVLESGWVAAVVYQGFGRTHRTNQAYPPLYRMVSTNVYGEQRFISSICGRLTQMGALIRGNRDATGQEMFQDSDDLESDYAAQALHFLYEQISSRKDERFSPEEFQKATGLKLDSDSDNQDTQQRFERPPMRRFLNRLLALPIEDQNYLSSILKTLHSGIIEAAIEAGTYESGLVALSGDTFKLGSRELLYTHPGTGSTTVCSEIVTTSKVHTLSSKKALSTLHNWTKDNRGEDEYVGLLINAHSGRPSHRSTHLISGKQYGSDCRSSSSHIPLI